MSGLGLTLHAAGRDVRVDLSAAHDLSLPLVPARPGRAFFVDGPAAAPLSAGGFVGDVRQGGSVNCDVVTLVPHGDGTHTECAGHITAARHSVLDASPAPLVPAMVLTALPTRATDTPDALCALSAPDDRVITAAALEAAWQAACTAHGLDSSADASDTAAVFATAIVIRTQAAARPDDHVFSGKNPPYMSKDAATWLVRRGCHHVLLDVPSVDREHDDGELVAHRAFFGLPAPARDLPGPLPTRTITEMIRVPDALADGPGLLVLGMAPLALDASPSRPWFLPALR